MARFLTLNKRVAFGAFVFLVSTIFDSYRTAETRLRTRTEARPLPESPSKDRTVAAWGIFLIVLGIIFLLKNFIHFYFINRLWPLAFIALGGYIIYRALSERSAEPPAGSGASLGEKMD